MEGNLWLAVEKCFFLIYLMQESDNINVQLDDFLHTQITTASAQKTYTEIWII